MAEEFMARHAYSLNYFQSTPRVLLFADLTHTRVIRPQAQREQDFCPSLVRSPSCHEYV